MNTDNLGALACRSIGLLLLILSLSTMLTALTFGVHSGWTSYSPLGRGEPDFSRAFGLFLRYYLPNLVQVLAGATLLLFSRPLGRLLARGLSDHAA